MSKDWMPRSISFSSGGVRGLGHIGVLVGLMEAGMTANVSEWYGCSAGAISAILGALGVSSQWLRDCIQHFDTRCMFQIQENCVSNFMSELGIDSGISFISYLGRFLETWEPGVAKWTFADLNRERPGIVLGITAVSLTTKNLELFSYTTTPNILILDAIRASCAIPFFYTPWKSPSGDLYCDGALIESFPWFHIKNKKESLVVACERSQIMGLSYKETNSQDYMRLIEFCSRLMLLRRGTLTTELPQAWIAVSNKSLSAFDFNMTTDERLALFQEGIVAADAWMAFKKTRPAKTIQSPADPEIQCTSLENHPSSVDKTSDSHQSRSPLQHLAGVLGSHFGTRYSGRRWSL
jgi:predicted acylesterase/phospholipase RssA